METAKSVDCPEAQLQRKKKRNRSVLQCRRPALSGGGGGGGDAVQKTQHNMYCMWLQQSSSADGASMWRER